VKKLNELEARKQELLKQIDKLAKWNDEHGQAIGQVGNNIEIIARVLEALCRMK
jgi:hypothetical protein